MYKITSSGITDGTKPYELLCNSNPFIATIIDFERLLLKQGFEFPEDFICRKSDNKIIFEYSYIETKEYKENIQLEFKVEKIND